MTSEKATSTWIEDGLSAGNYPAAMLFWRSYRIGILRKLWSIITRRPNRLHSLGDDKLHIRSSCYNGRREVAIDHIRGSESRSRDFDDHFHPLVKNSIQRWQSIARAYQFGTGLPPVELIQVGEEYYVRDGHHRISVARAFGFLSIYAEITVWNVE